MGPSGCGRSEVIRVLAKAISTGCDKPTNPYLAANNRKKVRVGAGWARVGWGCLAGATTARQRHHREEAVRQGGWQ